MTFVHTQSCCENIHIHITDLFEEGFLAERILLPVQNIDMKQFDVD